MPYLVELTPAATRELKRLTKRDQELARQLVQAIVDLEEQPRPPGCKKLKGLKATFRIRHGDYRIIYDVQDERLSILVIRLGHRREVY